MKSFHAKNVKGNDFWRERGTIDWPVGLVLGPGIRTWYQGLVSGSSINFPIISLKSKH